MKSAKGFGLSVLLSLGSTGFADLPKNNLHLYDDLHSKATTISEQDFNATIKKAGDLYKPIIKAQGGTLMVKGDWKDSTVNASAMQFFGVWYVNMYGGLARRPEVTQDGFVLVICHELGHHLGGYHFVSNWGASEGQSDYFATHSCAKKFWENEATENAKSRLTVNSLAKAKCDAIWKTVEKQDLCYRTVNAGKSLGDLLAKVSNAADVNFDTPDTSEVAESDPKHPKAQCRLDTLVSGALCVERFDENVIPGKKNGSGDNTEEAEEEAGNYSCTVKNGYTDGVRPRCWFKGLLD